MCTKMMEKYPTGIYFTSFEMYYQSAIEREKESRRKDNDTMKRKERESKKRKGRTWDTQMH